MRLFYLLALAALFGSCRSTKTIQTAMARKDSLPGPASDESRRDSLIFMDRLYADIMKNQVDFKTFSAKIKVDFEGADGKRNDFNATVRLQKDSLLWVSINAVFGIEGFRALITPDSVKVINKLDKVVQFRSVSYLQEITKLPFTFSELQDLILGNPVFFDSTITSYRKEGDQVSLLNLGDLFKHLLSINTTAKVIQHSKLDDINPVRGRSANISYGDYETIQGKPFSTFRKITLSERTKLDIQLKYKQVEFNVPLNFPFNIPKNFKLQ